MSLVFNGLRLVAVCEIDPSVGSYGRRTDVWIQSERARDREKEGKLKSINFPKDWYVVWMQNWTPHLICYHSMASDYVPMVLVVMLAS